MILVIMAAGMGSRFGGLKQIEPVGPNGEFIIDYSIYDAIKAGFDKVVFIIKEENYEIFKETIGKRIEDKIKVEYAFQKLDDIPDPSIIPSDRTKPFGTAHALYCARDYIDDAFAVISADDFYGSEPFILLHDSLLKGEYSAIGYKIGNTISSNGSVKRGVCFSENGYLTEIRESKVEFDGNNIVGESLINGTKYSMSKDQSVSMLMFGIQLDMIDYLKEDIKDFFNNSNNNLETCEYYLPNVLTEMIDKDICKIKLIPTKSTWKGITYKEDLDEFKKYIKEQIKEGVYPENLYD